MVVVAKQNKNEFNSTVQDMNIWSRKHRIRPIPACKHDLRDF